MFDVFHWFSSFLNTLLCLLRRCSWCFLLNFSVFSSLLLEQYRVTNVRREKKNQNVFFMFSRIRIHGRLTKNHECFRFSRHLPPASKQYQKSYLYLMPVPGERENHQETQNFHFFWKFCIFLITLEENIPNRRFLILWFF